MRSLEYSGKVRKLWSPVNRLQRPSPKAHAAGATLRRFNYSREDKSPSLIDTSSICHLQASLGRPDPGPADNDKPPPQYFPQSTEKNMRPLVPRVPFLPHQCIRNMHKPSPSHARRAPAAAAAIPQLSPAVLLSAHKSGALPLSPSTAQRVLAAYCAGATGHPPAEGVGKRICKGELATVIW